MADEAHVRLIDTHAEGDGGDHHHAIFLQEGVLVTRARAGVQPGVIGQRLEAVLAQELAECLRLLARAAIDDAALAAMCLEEIGDLLAAPGFRPHRQPQVGPVEAMHEHRWLAPEQLIEDVGAGARIRRGGECDGLHPAERGLDIAEAEIFRPEIVPPLRDAMRFIDREQADVRTLQQRNGVGFRQPLRRDVKESQLSPRHLLEYLPVLVEVVGRVEARGRDTVGAQLGHLVAHERDQRRHHHGEPAADQRRQLIAERLPATRRHHRQHVTARKDGADDIGLPRPERIEAEGGAKSRLGGCKVGHAVPLKHLFYICSNREARRLMRRWCLPTGSTPRRRDTTDMRHHLVCKCPQCLLRAGRVDQQNIFDPAIG